jgi:recombination protein RecR
MTRIDHPESLKRLAVQLRRLPGIGPRGAERIALWLLGGKDRTRSSELASAMLQAAESVRPCPECGFLTDTAQCAICADETRASGPLCVVEEATDILPLERTGAFRGRYHALGGRLAPLDHVGPEDLRIPGLLNRCRTTPAPSEVILALSADVEGEATAHYLAELLHAEFPRLPITRIAQGLPAGGGLESADELTLSRALSGRTQMN